MREHYLGRVAIAWRRLGALQTRIGSSPTLNCDTPSQAGIEEPPTRSVRCRNTLQMRRAFAASRHLKAKAPGYAARAILTAGLQQRQCNGRCGKGGGKG